uniref:RxLR effector candidate protein n=1 Tax=Hyaloperonospora arabidopsidis (strain Emoy2) TaxID=559515 RepID=M4B6E5_HYAAE|nr:RxLR effector candidate protein [Hyaloperonospora arabidopsidis Emoy2]
MPFCSRALLATFALLTRTKGTREAADPGTTAFHHPSTVHSSVDNQSEDTSSKALISFQGEQDGEERGKLKELVIALTSRLHLKSDQLRKWQNDNVDPSDILMKMREHLQPKDSLEEIALAILCRSDILALDRYFESKNMSLIRTLVLQFTDTLMVKVLVRAKQSKHGVGATNANLLLDKLMNEWNSDIRPKSFLEVFTFLDFTDTKFLHHFMIKPELDVLQDYIKLRNGVVLDTKDYFDTLTTGFGGESKFSMIMDTAFVDPVTIVKAKELQGQQFEMWEASEKSPIDIFERLEMAKDKFELFTEHPHKLRTLSEYIEKFGLTNQNGRRCDLMTTVIEGFGGDAKFALLVMKAQETEGLSMCADQILLLLFQAWEKRGITLQNLVSKMQWEDTAETGLIMGKFKMYSEGRFRHSLNLSRNVVLLKEAVYGPRSS